MRVLSSVAARLADSASAHRGLFVGIVVAVALVAWSITGVLVWFLGALVTGLPGAAELRSVGSMARATTVFDAGGRPAFTLYTEQRIEVPLSRISPHLVRAVVTVEDQRFFRHGGVDAIRLAGAAWGNLRDGWGTQGGSTITQQLARQSFLTPEKTVSRKLKEIIVAARLENEFTKHQILEMYLNKIYFGDGLYGAEAASLGYFGKHAAHLDLAEAALLAGLVKAPSTYAPTVNLERAIARRNAVLRTMREARVIDERVYRTALGRKVRLEDALRAQEGYGQYFKEEVRKALVGQFGWERVYQGGLKVHTTLDLDLQKAAEAEVQRAIRELEQRGSKRIDEKLQAALVALDPYSGEVRALVGGRSFDESRFNRATQARRQAGSAFKPFIYAAALERGYTPASVIRSLDTPVMTVEGAWLPEDHTTGDAMTIRAALRSSSNRAAVRMLEEIGIPAAVRYAGLLGVGSVPAVPSLALGSGEVTLLSMTAAYAAFANGGMRPVPRLIRRVESAEGHVLYTTSPRAERAISEATAFLMTTMLADVVNAGSAWRARRSGFTRPAAGKTGTTNDYRDAWFIGYTPHLATGVWVGYDQPRTILGRGYAATVAVPLWGRFMAGATRRDPPDGFRPPPTVTTATICRLSGQLATRACHNVVTIDADGYLRLTSTAYTEYFVRGTEPDEHCTMHTLEAFGPPLAAWTPAPLEPPHAPGVTPPAATNGTVTGSAGTPAAPPATGGAPAPPAPSPIPATEPRRTRRGFWSRFFGIGRSRDDQPVIDRAR